MKTKRFLSFMLATALMGGLSLSVTSCKSDEDAVVEKITPSTVTIDSDILAYSVNSDY